MARRRERVTGIRPTPHIAEYRVVDTAALRRAEEARERREELAALVRFPPINPAPMHTHLVSSVGERYAYCRCGWVRDVTSTRPTRLAGDWRPLVGSEHDVPAPLPPETEEERMARFIQRVEMRHTGQRLRVAAQAIQDAYHTHSAYRADGTLAYCGCGWVMAVLRDNTPAGVWIEPTQFHGHTHHPNTTDGLFEYCLHDNCRARRPVWQEEGRMQRGLWGEEHPYTLPGHRHAIARTELENDDGLYYGVCRCGCRHIEGVWLSPPLWVDQEVNRRNAAGIEMVLVLGGDGNHWEEARPRPVCYDETIEDVDNMMRVFRSDPNSYYYDGGVGSATPVEPQATRIPTGSRKEQEELTFTGRIKDWKELDEAICQVIAFLDPDVLAYAKPHLLYERYQSFDVLLAVLRIMSERVKSRYAAEEFMKTAVRMSTGGKAELVFKEELEGGGVELLNKETEVRHPSTGGVRKLTDGLMEAAEEETFLND